MSDRPRSAFVTWYPYCRRSDAIAAALGGESHLIHFLTFKRPSHAPLKYVLQTFATLWRLIRERPDLVLVAVPPVFAAWPVWLYARLSRARVVIDAHTGIFDHARWAWLLPLTRAVFRAADSVIVTSEPLARRVRSWGAHATVIGAVPVTFARGREPAPVRGARIVVVNTFSVDEPVDAVIEVARRLPELDFFVTGDTGAARPEWLAQAGGNLQFTGFVSEQDYSGLLSAADVVVVLTTADHTMQRGGYEAMALGKPLVTSDWGILRDTFHRGTVHVANEPGAIEAGIRAALSNADELSAEMRELRDMAGREFEAALSGLLATAGWRTMRVRTSSAEGNG